MVADLDEAAARKAAGKTGEAFWGDLSEEKVAGALIGQTVQTLGAPAILVNNAGGGILRPFLDHTPETLRTTIDRNLWTAIWCSWHALPHMRRSEEHTSELQSLMRISYAVFCLKKKKTRNTHHKE